MGAVIDRAVVVVAVLIGIMSMVDTLALSVRTSGAMTRRLALALSLFNLLVVFSRVSNLIQAPIVGNMADKTVVADPMLHQQLIGLLLCKIHVIIVATSIGTIIGGLLTPSFVRIFSRMISLFEEVKTLPRMAWALMNPRRSFGFLRHLTRPFGPRLPGYFRGLRRIPVDFLVFQVLVTAFYTVGVLSTIYAAALEPGLRATAVTLSGIVNGIATLLLFILVDPPGAMITDQCINQKRPLEDVKVMNLYLVIARFLGTVLAQFIIVATAYLVLWAAGIVNRIF